MTADIVIKGGTVVDGTGAPGYRADVAITGSVITDIGPDLDGGRVLDATGQVVSPGFVDIHSHYDAQVFWDPALTPSSYHGVTSVVAGNCGFSIAPVRPGDGEVLAKTLKNVEDMSEETLIAGVPWGEFETFPQYLDAVQRHGTVINFGCYVGHTALSIYVMGEAAFERGPDAAELAQMRALVSEALAAGAIGFASSHAPTHNGEGGRPVPSRFTGLEELRELLAPLREQNRGVAALLPAQIISDDELFELQREIGRPFTWTALLTRHGSDFHYAKIEANDKARAEGVEVWPQVSGRPLVFQMNLRDPFTLNTRPAFKELVDGPRDERIAAYTNPEWRARAFEQLSNGGFGVNWDSTTVAESERHPELIGRLIRDIARDRGVTELDAMLDVALDDDLDTRFRTSVANDDEEGVAYLIPRDNVLLGLADSGAHISQLCDACFATDLLGTWVRDKQVMPLERAIHKLSEEPAAVYGLTDRGVVEVGRKADVNVFDPDTVAPGPLHRMWDFPANGERLVADAPVGMTHTLVNGTPIRVDGQPDPDALTSRPGQVLRG
ncbi:MAG: N-acyl-D-aspartate/D-glutamate deacylase [Actinomycetia bacterium]|nr:N-acyl-D-aspartate/D-glutamate deacylase [Actinomycetes bacterium]